MLTALDVIKQFANDFREFKSVMLDWAKTLHSEVNEETESFKMTYDISNDSESKSVDVSVFVESKIALEHLIFVLRSGVMDLKLQLGQERIDLRRGPIDEHRLNEAARLKIVAREILPEEHSILLIEVSADVNKLEVSFLHKEQMGENLVILG